MTIKRRSNIYPILIHWEAPVEQLIGTRQIRALQAQLHTRGKSKLTIRSTEIFHEEWPSITSHKDQIVCIQISRRTILIVRRFRVQTETVKSWGPRLRPWDQIRDSKTRIHLLRSITISTSTRESITLILILSPLATMPTWCISLIQKILMLRARSIRKLPLPVRWLRNNL